MEKKKQNSVEWLFDQLCSEKFSWIKGSNDKIYFDKITSDLLQQAKAMHKEEVEQYGAMCCLRTTQKNQWSLEGLYNETFGGQDEN